MAFLKISLTKVDLPEPLTPVTQVKQPRGTVNLTFLRLLALAPFSVNTRFLSIGRRCAGTGILSRPER